MTDAQCDRICRWLALIAGLVFGVVANLAAILFAGGFR